MKRLFKVTVETDIMVISDGPNKAIETAIKNAPNEVGLYGRGDAIPINSISEIPEDWKSVIPYCQDGMGQEIKKCYEIASEYQKNSEKGLDEKDIQEIVRIRKESKPSEKEVVPETRSDPKPRELNWKETESGRPMPHLRFRT